MKQKTRDNIQITILISGVALGFISAWAIQLPLNMFGANFITIKHIVNLWLACPLIGGFVGFCVMLKI